MRGMRPLWRVFNALPTPAARARAGTVTPRNRDAAPAPASRPASPAAGRPSEAGPSSEWYKLVRNSAEELTLYLYGTVGGDWFDEGITADRLRDELQEFTGHTLNVHINSPGGSVFEGIAVQNLLANHPAQVNVSVDGLAASIASVIAMAGDTITMCPGSMMMIHEASGLAWGNAADMRQLAGVLDKISGNIADAYARRAGGDPSEWRTAMHAETWYTADEAVEAGLAHQVKASKASPADQGPRDDETPPAMAEPAEDVAAKVPEHVYRFRDRAHAPAPVIVHRQPRNRAEPTPEPVPTPAVPETPAVDMDAVRAAFGLSGAVPAAAAQPGVIDHEEILAMFKPKGVQA